MQRLTSQGQQLIADLAQRYGTSTDAVLNLLDAVMAGNGTMAQFNHPDLGGSGQWMQGGMTMVGDMFNGALKFKVDGLCSELSKLLSSATLFAPVSYPVQNQGAAHYADSQVSLFVSSGQSGQWWPADLGIPSTTGSQNSVRYAYFPAARRLAVDVNGQVTLYDTLGHQIGGVSQQQGGDASVTFTSQFGLVSLSSLPVLSSSGAYPAAAPVYAPEPPASFIPNATTNAGPSDDILGTIERLATLHKNGVLSDQEFATKKAELLARL
ncbi:MAG TPA: SHOCT domain-containing protein [Candidatus Competibacteraceae bacterium]|nr:SHOCT domain-containing protein [Candidatus Competibacteraceae bacterium]HRZ05943.1 SHOCT domain-containing protein [Candidatus Competibacteraceae bacterium]HSA45759.1 SHOCT domain-containing protein [Candidatus Competibacteraceae bacterium]